MAFTWSDTVIGLSTDTTSDTLLPFSTSGGTSSFTRPSVGVALPTTFLIASAMESGVADAGASGRTTTTAAVAAVPARKRRRSIQSFNVKR
jgi:hypothetical protein